MDTRVSDEEIASLLQEEKRLPQGLYPLKAMTARSQHKRKNFDVEGTEPGHQFVVAVRQSLLNFKDFSVILGYQLPGTYTVFRLRRYNGSSHRHTNAIEKQIIDGFHIHTATARYQAVLGFPEDHFAEPTTRYGGLESAIECLLSDCGFDSTTRTPLFTGSL